MDCLFTAWKKLDAHLKIFAALETFWLFLVFVGVILCAMGWISVPGLILFVAVQLALAVATGVATAVADWRIRENMKALAAPPAVDTVLHALEKKHGKIFTVGPDRFFSDEIVILRGCQIIYRQRGDSCFAVRWSLDDLARACPVRTLQDTLDIIEQGEPVWLPGPGF